MGLKDVLQKNAIPLPPDFDERMDLLISALKRKSNYNEKLKSFKQKRGGADGDAARGEDWLGPELNTFIDVITTPGARVMLQGVFAVVFFVKYLENIPIFGRILSATLDIMVMGGKMLTKTIQKSLPPIMGLLPLPYASAFGLVLASAFGMIVWPVIGLVALSRADFTAAIESFIRVIPAPIGDTLADLFLEGNRTVARLNEKRSKLVGDLTTVFTAISDAVSSSSKELKKGFGTLSESIKNAPRPSLPPTPTMPTPTMPSVPTPPTPEIPTVPTPTLTPTPPTLKGGKRLSRRKHMKNKWRNKTQRRK